MNKKQIELISNLIKDILGQKSLYFSQGKLSHGNIRIDDKKLKNKIKYYSFNISYNKSYYKLVVSEVNKLFFLEEICFYDDDNKRIKKKSFYYATYLYPNFQDLFNMINGIVSCSIKTDTKYLMF
jgi:hypothetical protein